MLIYNSVITEAVMRTWLHGQAVKTLASHAGIRGSIPLGVTFERVSAEEFCGYFFCLKAFVFKGFEALKIFLVLGGCMKL